MPIYEYRCSQCRHKLEALQKFSDAPLVACPACGRDALVKPSRPPASSSRAAAGTRPTSAAAASRPRSRTPASGDGQARRPRPRAKTDAAKTDAATAKPRRASRQDGAKPRPPSPQRRRADVDRRLARASRMKRYLSPASWSGCRSASRSGCCISCVTTLDQTLLLLPEVRAPGRAHRLPHSRASACC